MLESSSVKVTAVEDDEESDLPEIEHWKLGPGTVTEGEVYVDPFADPAREVKALQGVSAVTKRRITNEIKKFNRGSSGAESKKLEAESVTGYQAFEVIEPPYNLDYLAALYEVSSPHYAAVNAKTANIVGLGIDYVESPRTKEKLEDMEEDADKLKKFRRKLSRAKNDLIEKIDSLNEDETFAEVLTKVWIDYETTGNGYIEIGRTNRGDIGYIGHIPATTLRVRRKRDGFVQIIADKAVFFRNFGDKKTTDPVGNDSRPNELIHIKKYSPRTAYYGISDIIAAKQALAGNEFAARFNLDYFENKAVPRHIITLKGARLSSGAETAIMQFFETGLKGKNHRSLYIPLPADNDTTGKVEFKIEAVEAGVQDSSFNNYRKGNLNEMLMAHRVPLSKVGMAEGVSLAMARDADKTFKEQVCRPEQDRLQKKLNKIIREFTDIFYLKLNELTLTDADTQSKIDERDIKNQIRTPNEVRATRGMAGLKGGDKVVELKPQQAAEARAQGNRARDAERSANSPDTSGEARQPKGEGRVTA